MVRTGAGGGSRVTEYHDFVQGRASPGNRGPGELVASVNKVDDARVVKVDVRNSGRTGAGPGACAISYRVGGQGGRGSRANLLVRACVGGGWQVVGNRNRRRGLASWLRCIENRPPELVRALVQPRDVGHRRVWARKSAGAADDSPLP